MSSRAAQFLPVEAAEKGLDTVAYAEQRTAGVRVFAEGDGGGHRFAVALEFDVDTVAGLITLDDLRQMLTGVAKGFAA